MQEISGREEKAGIISKGREKGVRERAFFIRNLGRVRQTQGREQSTGEEVGKASSNECP